MLLGDTDVFPRPFEFQAIQFSWNQVRDFLSQQDLLSWRVRPHRTTLSTKAHLGFRAITQLDPLDFIVFSALIRDICEDLELRRVPITDQVAYSYRCKPSADGRLFDREIGYGQFLQRAREVLESDGNISHVAITDIADFYPRIYHHRLENALSAATLKSDHVKAIMGLLKGWNNSETFGIPVGSAPATVLAEATLIDVDQ